ncbi:MAG TPA: DUF3352 domain-containing protein [Verrucomicrobiae bacterium]|nr:DUF3352 domain-containing protein [Verrucomicrobiae bacterium]
MKTNRLFAFSCVAALVAGAVLFNGCGKRNPAAAPVPDAFKTTSPKSAEPTSFDDVAKNLDAGGDFYLYLSTEKWLDGLSDKMAGWRGLLANAPMDADDKDSLNKGFDLATRIVRDSGIEDVSGFGMSSIAIDKGVYRTKMVMHHYQGKGSGFGWTMFGKAPHALNGLDMAPASTAMVIFMDADFAQLWSVVQDEVKHSGFPQAQQFLDQIPYQFKTNTGLDLNTALASLGGEYGIILTLDDSRKVALPLPTATPIEISDPGLLIVARVNDDTLFKRLEKLMAQSGMQVTRSDKGDVKMRTLEVPIPLPITLHPTLAMADGWLFISTSDTLIEEALAVKSGATPGLKSTEEFKALAQGMPTQGNQYSFASKRFGTNMLNVQQQMMAAQGEQVPGITKLMQQFYAGNAQNGFSVGGVSDEGFTTVMNGTQSGAKIAVLIPVVFVGGMLGAIAVPNFVQARSTAQRNACINNLRQIDGSKEQWALENKKNNGAIPTEADISPYMRGGMPVCPQGGEYTINAVGTPPSCSIHGALP